MGVSLVAAMTYGIVVDDTIHFLNKFLSSVREDGMSVAAAVKKALDSVGYAIIKATSV